MADQLAEVGCAVIRQTVCIVQPNEYALTETFIRAHSENLPAPVAVLSGYLPVLDGQPILRQSWPNWFGRKCYQLLVPQGADRIVTSAFSRAFRQLKPDIVLAEYGPMGVRVAKACRHNDIPLVVHFHGYDVSERITLKHYAVGYRALFEQAAALVVVSRPMQAQLISLGAPPAKVHYNPYGVDCHRFNGSEPAAAPPVLLAVGRFVEKKAPQVTITAFAEACRGSKLGQLRMIGDGPLMGECQEMVERLGISDAVKFLGAQPPAVVAEEMRRSRAFVQHSVQAPNGDSEGMPLSILEAGASGLPVISTRHAGIPEMVIDGQTGLLVDEHDTDAMALAMRRVLEDREFAARMGHAARMRVATHFTVEKSMAGLWSILLSCAPRLAEGPASETVRGYPA